MHKQDGISLVELIIVIGLFIILISVSLPTLRGILQNNRISTATNSLIYSLNFAKISAEKYRQNITVCPKTAPNNNSCGSNSDWGNGWLIYYMNGNAMQVLRQQQQLPNDINLSSSTNNLSFKPSGMMLANIGKSFTISSNGCLGNSVKTINITIPGHINVSSQACN